ncbi:hypothetical protein FMJ36_16915 [Klebsiella michiganensis]|uniref:hypothetical protein n=1 Tax=Klebsiella michiganensis TaxID=1134687 RepID=UPI001CCA3A87|nr:hypothetical protein [Klebsiella michiganensis]MBZ7499679.1 hypothetical protein [Klebsiella michiganensis]
MTSKLTITDDRIAALLDCVEMCEDMSVDENAEMATALRELQERRKADSEPVAVVEPSDYVTAAQLVGEGPDRKAVHELYEGALRIGDKLYRHAQPAPVVPDEMTPEMMRAVQLHSELGTYATANMTGAYDLFAEFWKVAYRAAPQEVK